MPQRKQRQGQTDRRVARQARIGAEAMCSAAIPSRRSKPCAWVARSGSLPPSPDTPGATKRPAQPAPRRKRPAPSAPAEQEAGQVWSSLHPARHGGARRSHRASPPGSSPAAPTCRGVVTTGTGLEQVAPDKPGKRRKTPKGRRAKPTRPKTRATFREGAGVFNHQSQHHLSQSVVNHG